ncbi:hypothetical protein K470DRAFT_283155 [Piedraia hortae CBS 480.64]|uniref:Protein PBN1 n=1 Tax=Piedraia hortae CBS 480.64 TaxID=1314780 RepID=A0A6A7BV92_9PEZI|nr:hypothetical protein K470DRAFT_283155 [Piedraia hortae CBS 480.64]
MRFLPILFAYTAVVFANTEKTVFKAPISTVVVDGRPGFEDLRLDTLSPTRSTLRLTVPVVFPTEEHPSGLDSWFLLHGLEPERQYEVRVCWAAVQPTAVTVDTFNISHVFDTPELITSLATFSERQSPKELQQSNIWLAKDYRSSILFLRVQSAADFFTSAKELMQNPPAVEIDIILDPYIANLLPSSTVSIVGFVATLAVAGWVVSGVISKRLHLDKERTD